MPTYQIYFDTQAGEKSYNVKISENETLEGVLTDVISDLDEEGYILTGREHGDGNLVVTWQGRELDQLQTLPVQGVKPNDVLRVGIKVEPQYDLRLRHGQETRDVNGREELHDGYDLLIGKTVLRFQLSKRAKQGRNQDPSRTGRSGDFQKRVYFMALVGGIAGLLCWFLVSWIPFLPFIRLEAADVINLTVLGLIIGGLTVGFNDHWSGDRVVFRWVLMGIAIGAMAGVIGGLISSPIRLVLGEPLRWLAIPTMWTIGGALIGFGASLRWLFINRVRAIHGLAGGLFGGLLGGVLFWFLPNLGIGADISQAFGFVLTGVGITCGVSLAPILMRQGLLVFVNSGDEEVLAKYARTGAIKQWEIHDGGNYTIGSLRANQTRTVFVPPVQIFIPDRYVAPQHAILIAKKGKYFIEPHPQRAEAIGRLAV
jgi:hypothetical protein